MSRYPDVAPTIIVERNYGRYAHGVHFDVEGIAEYLRNGGLTDEEIIDTTVLFSDEHPPYDKGIDSELAGVYEHDKRQLTVYGIYWTFDAYASLNINSGRAERLRENANSTLLHELEHRVSSLDEEQQKENNGYVRSVAAMRLGTYAAASTVGAIAATSFAEGLPVAVGIAAGSLLPAPAVRKLHKSKAVRRHYYRHKPEEIRCYDAAATREPKDLVYIFQKPLDITHHQTAEEINELIFELELEYEDLAAVRAEIARLEKEEEAQAREVAAQAKQLETFNKWLGVVLRSPLFRI